MFGTGKGMRDNIKLNLMMVVKNLNYQKQMKMYILIKNINYPQ